MSTERTRNFSIIAHIDHGKTTLSDRLLEYTRTISEREQQDQLLDSMDLERERGITIKSHPVTMEYTAKDGCVYKLNLLDTPGHVDFSYEVSRSLAACEGAILIVDAAQGVEAQTVANLHLATEQDLTIVPIINKIDLPSADLDMAHRQLEDILAIPAEEAIPVSAKMGLGIEDVLEAIVERVPPPSGPDDNCLRASVFDSVYNSFRGVVSYIRVFSGAVKRGSAIRMMSTGKAYEVKEVGVFTPKMEACDVLETGDVGYLIANMKSSSEVKIGDTVTESRNPAPEPLPGFKEIQPMVFSGIYPVTTDDFEQLKLSMGKLQINDAAFQYSAESSAALGFGFRCGFLGLLHLEIIQERLEREFDMDLVTTAPGVLYRVTTTDGKVSEVDSPAKLPDAGQIEALEEPVITAMILTPADHVGGILQLCQDKRGIQKGLEYLASNRVMITYELPFNEVVLDFYDKLKTLSRGYASLDYHVTGYWTSPLVKLDLLVNEEPVDALSVIAHKDSAYSRGRALAVKLRKLIPRQMFEVAIQATVGGRIIARETVKAMRKNVLAKCYGGDISRKRKLLEKQKEGKRRMKRVGRVEIPQEAFLAVLTVDSE